MRRRLRIDREHYWLLDHGQGVAVRVSLPSEPAVGTTAVLWHGLGDRALKVSVEVVARAQTPWGHLEVAE